MFAKKFLAPVLAGLFLIGFALPAQAEFFTLSVGVPVAAPIKAEDSSGAITYSEDGSPSGYLIHAELPILVGFGVEHYESKIKSEVGGVETTYSDNSRIETDFYDIFYTFPIPVIRLSAGIGVGTVKAKCDSGCEDFKSGTATQFYASLGWPVVPFFDIHVSMHQVNAGTIKDGSDNDLIKFNGSQSMTAVGIGFGF